MFGRNFTYMQDLARQPIIAAWQNARTNVLALYGDPTSSPCSTPTTG